MTVQLPFTRRIHKFLVQEGYTYIRLMGVSQNDKFILVPLKDSVLNKFEEVDFNIEDINSTEVTDMLYPIVGLDFYVELPAEIADRFEANID